jgi:hypothetical protein
MCGDAFWLGVREKERQVITRLSQLFAPPSTTIPFPSNKNPLPAPTPNSKHQLKKKIGNTKVPFGSNICNVMGK